MDPIYYLEKHGNRNKLKNLCERIKKITSCNMNVVIIEDEKPSARLLERKLNAIGVEVNMKLHSVEDSIQWFVNNPEPDLIFLDIQLSDGLSLEIFETVKIVAPVIFTTAYDEYAIQAFKLNSIDYLLKPIDKNELSFAVNKFKSNFQNENKEVNLSEIKKLISNNSKEYKKRFTVNVGTSIKIFNTIDIACFYSQDKTSFLLTNSGRSYILDSSLDKIYDTLDPEVFFKVNRKYVLNINEIKDIINYSNSRLKVNLNTPTEDDIIVARDRVKAFKNWLS